MPYHITFVCGRCGERNMSPAITPELFQDTMDVLALTMLPGVPDDVGCSTCRPSSVDDKPSQVAGRQRAIYGGPVKS